jgi:hypothetical protein
MTDYGKPWDIEIQVTGGSTWRAGDVSAEWGNVTPGGNESATWKFLTRSFTYPAPGAIVNLYDLVGGFWRGRICRIRLAIFLTYMAVSVTALGDSRMLGKRRYHTRQTWAKGTPAMTIITDAVSQLGQGVTVDPTLYGRGVQIEEVSENAMGKSARDIVGQYLSYGVAGNLYSWTVSNGVFYAPAKGDGGVFVGYMPDAGAGEGVVLEFDIDQVDNEVAIEWEDTSQGDYPIDPLTGSKFYNPDHTRVVTLDNTALQSVWPNGVGAIHEKYISGGGQFKSQSEVQSAASSVLGNALGIESTGGQIMLPYPMVLNTDFPVWRLPENSYIRIPNLPAGFPTGDDSYVVRTHWVGDSLMQTATIGVLQTQTSAIRRSILENNIPMANASVAGASVPDLWETTRAKGDIGGYARLDPSVSDPNSGQDQNDNTGRVPHNEIPHNVNHAGIPASFGDGVTPLTTGVTRFLPSPIKFNAHNITLIAEVPPTGGWSALTVTVYVTSPPSTWPTKVSIGTISLASSLYYATKTGINLIDKLIEQGDIVTFEITTTGGTICKLTCSLDGTRDPDEPSELWTKSPPFVAG